MKKSEGFFQKMFGGFASGSSRVPLHSNIFQTMGRTGSNMGRWGERQSPLLGNSTPSNLISAYYSRIDELKQYYLLDVTKMATGFFADYVTNFLEDSAQQAVTILNEDRDATDEVKTNRINDILLGDLKIFDYIRDHSKDYVYWNQYTSLIRRSRDELGHVKFRFEELYDPISVVSKKTKDAEGGTKETFLTRGDDGKIYEVPEGEAFTLGNVNLRLINDLEENKGLKKQENKPKMSEGQLNYEKITRRCSYSAGEPLFYSLILKVKELIIKELLVSLISLRDLSSVQIFMLQFDKSTPMETAKELCARTTKLANNTNELASFLTSQFDIPSFIENTLSKSAKFVPDYNSTIGNKNNMLPLDKLSDKVLDMLQSLDACRNNVLSPLGIPSTILDSTSGSKWAILQQSERANSRVATYMAGIKDSVTNLVCTIYKSLYNEELDPSRVKTHISEKTSVEYNNQINQSESINGLMNGISQVISGALQTLDTAAPYVDTKAYLGYVRNLIKDIDPDAESMINETTIDAYVEFARAKLRAQAEQLGIENIDEIFQKLENPEETTE